MKPSFRPADPPALSPGYRANSIQFSLVPEGSEWKTQPRAIYIWKKNLRAEFAKAVPQEHRHLRQMASVRSGVAGPGTGLSNFTSLAMTEVLLSLSSWAMPSGTLYPRARVVGKNRSDKADGDASVVTNPSATMQLQEMWVLSLDGEILEEEWATHSSILARESW